MRLFFLIFSCGVGICLSGCSTLGHKQFGCSGLPAGVVCEDPVTVYHQTNNKDEVIGATKNGKPIPVKTAIVMPHDITSQKLFVPGDGPTPILEPAQVMRIWIAPWIDDRDDLHWPSYIFTEVTPHRWTFGQYGINKVQALVPLQVTQRVRNPNSSSGSETLRMPLGLRKLRDLQKQHGWERRGQAEAPAIQHR